MKDSDYLFKVFEEKVLYLKYLLCEIDNSKVNDILRNQHIESISIYLRNILIDRGKQISLISQIGIIDKMFFSMKLEPLSGLNNLISEAKLCGYHVSSEEAMYINKHEVSSKILIDYDTWLNEVVIDNKDDSDNLVTRNDIILVIADKEAAHTDPDYERIYDKIVNQKRMNFKIEVNGRSFVPLNNVYKESLVTIAKEFIDSFELFISLKNTHLIRRYSNRIAILMSQPIRKNVNGYRYHFWIEGTAEKEASLMNRIHFAYLKISNISYYYGQVVNLIDSNGSQTSLNIMFFDYPQKLVKMDFILEKNIFYAYYRTGDRYVLMGGSQLGIDTKLNESSFIRGKHSIILKHDLICKNIEELKLFIGHNIIAL